MDAQAIFFTNQKGDDQLIVATESFLNGTRRGITTFAQVQTTGEIAVHEADWDMAKAGVALCGTSACKRF